MAISEVALQGEVEEQLQVGTHPCLLAARHAQPCVPCHDVFGSVAP